MFVVTMPSSAAMDPTRFAERAKKAGADLLEIRGDLTPALPPFVSALPLIVSPRGTGKMLMEVHKPTFVDLAIDETMDVSSGIQIIRSVHDHRGTPSLERLQTTAEQMLKAGADIMKIATTILTYKDILTLQDLQKNLPADRAHVILGMGPKAHLTRMLSPLHNALTYTFLEEADASALGQLSLSMHKLTAHCKQPKIFGILGGSSCSRSLSPCIHNNLFQRHNIDALYSIFPTDDLDEEWESLMTLGIAGLSITSPWKRAVISKLNHIEATAERSGAVNTAIKRDAGWIGYPRDAEGMMGGYPFLQRASSAVIIGSGGVVPEVIAACRMAGIRDIRVYARNEDDRTDLAKRFTVQSFPLEELIKQPADIVICTISSDVSVPLPLASDGAHAIDLRYGKMTQFMKDAKERGYIISDGTPMLLCQAALQYELFTGIRPSEDDMHMLENLISIPS